MSRQTRHTDHPPVKTRLRAFATDFDGTLAHDGTVPEAALAGLDRLKRAGFVTLLLTGREIADLAKVLYPEAGFTKAQVIDYYTGIAPVLLPHLKNRPITLKRYPDGVEGFFFYEKQCPSHRPNWIKTAAVSSRRRKEGRIDYC